MEGNPYANLIVKMREDALEGKNQNYRFGEVLSINPLRIEVGGTVQDRSNLLIGQGLYGGNEVLQLLKNDSVVLLSIEEEQKFIILCKVVKA